MVGGEVEIVHGAGQVEIGIGIEALDEDRALMAQVALDLEIRVEGEGRRLAVLQPAAELPVQRGFRQIGDVRAHARHGQPLLGPDAMQEIAPAAPVRIGHHRLPPDFVEGDVLRRVPRSGRQRGGREDAVWIARSPLQHLHPAHRAADHGEERVDAEMVDQGRLRADHVADGDEGEIEPVGRARRRIGRGRPGGAQAAAQHVRADDEEAVRVDRPARSDQHLPPAGLAGDRIAFATCWSPVNAWQTSTALERSALSVP